MGITPSYTLFFVAIVKIIFSVFFVFGYLLKLVAHSSFSPSCRERAALVVVSAIPGSFLLLPSVGYRKLSWLQLAAAAATKSLRSQTTVNPRDGGPPGSVHKVGPLLQSTESE